MLRAMGQRFVLFYFENENFYAWGGYSASVECRRTMIGCELTADIVGDMDCLGVVAFSTYHLEGIAGPAGCDGECADLRTGNARGAADAGAEEEGSDFARHCEEED